MLGFQKLTQNSTRISLGLNLGHCSEKTVTYHISPRTVLELLSMSVVYTALNNLHQLQGTLFHPFSWQLHCTSKTDVYHVM